MSPKTTLYLVTHLFYLGKFLDLASREIFSTEFAMAKLVLSWLCLGVFQ